MVTKGFFAGMTEEELASQGRTRDILPVNKADGAPTKAEYLLEIDDDNIETKLSKSNQNYCHMQLTVVEPERFAGRKVFYNLNLVKKDGTRMDWVSGHLMAIGGRELINAMPGETEAACNFLCEHLPGHQFVGRLIIEESEGFDDQNSISQFFPRSRWAENAAGVTRIEKI